MALAVVLGVHLFALIHGIVFARIWGDEAYNLTVPINLAAGHGYASDGILTSGRYDLFDPRVSTGPTVLLPIAGVIAMGIDPVTAGRIVMTLLYAGAVVAIGLVGWRVAGRSGLVLALAVALAFDATNPDSPMQSPVDVIGEWPAAGLLALAIISLRRRPWLAGLLLGVAVQAKIVMLLCAPVLVLLLFVGAAPLRSRLRDASVFVTLTVAPTLLFEAIKLVVLGPEGYAAWFRGFLDFLLLKKGHFLPLDKARALLDSWFIPSTWVVVLVVVLAVGATLLAIRRFGWRRGLAAVAERDAVWIVVTCALLAVVWTLWWFQSRADLIWIRHLFPGFVPGAAGLLAGAWAAWSWLRVSGYRPERFVAGAAAAVCALALAVSLGGRLWYVTNPPLPETLPDQRVVADVVRDQGGDELVGPWGSMPIAILAGKHPVPLAFPHEASATVLLVSGEEGWDDPELCGLELWTDGVYRLCLPAGAGR